MRGEFTAVLQRRGKWYIGFVEEIPGVNTQGRTLKEVRENLREVLTLILESNRMIAKKAAKGGALHGRTSTVPRHREINDFLARKICRDLGVEEP